MKDFSMWNKATIAKLIWAIPKKNDILWVRWVHGRYLKGKTWRDHIPAADSSWYWKKLCQIRDSFVSASNSAEDLERLGGDDYKVSHGYLWQMRSQGKVP